MKRKILSAVLFFILGLSFGGCTYYNRMVEGDEEVSKSWSEVENQLQRRNDLIPNYVNTVKGFAKQEREVFIKVTEARSKVMKAGSVKEKMDASNQLSGALGRLMVVVERYPDLKSNQNFMALQDELAGTENRIAVARMRYNEAVKSYNAYIRKFPQLLISKSFGFESKPYFEAPEEAKELPEVAF